MFEADPSIVPVPVAPPTAASTSSASTILADFRAELAELGSEVDRMQQDATCKVAVLERAAAALGIRVEPLLSDDGVLGCSVGGAIRIRPGLPQRDRVAELAHELLPQGDEAQKLSDAEVETEADATSYVVLRALGLPSKAPSYIAWRGGSGALIARSLGRIQRAARQILDAGASNP